MNDSQILKFVKTYTIVSEERLQNVLDLVNYVVKHDISGDFIEIGVYKGGIIMAMALKCLQLGVTRTIYAYDTFSGMTNPTDVDESITKLKAKDAMNMEDTFCFSSLEETRNNIEKTSYPHVIFCKGDVTKTEIETIPKEIALLRLDTDWYESTKFELDFFEPNVVKKGVIIIDDYGHWKGCKKAVDEFLLTREHLQIKKIDYTGIYWAKT